MNNVNKRYTDENGEPRRTHTELRVVFKEHLYYIYAVSIYDDDPTEYLLFPTPLTTPKASLEEMKKYIDQLKVATDKPIIVI